MLEFFHTKDRLRFLLMVGAIAVPLLLVAIWVVTAMETDSAAKGEPNAQGGLHYRIQEKKGATALPPALAALVPIPPGSAMTDVNVDTDKAGRVASATIKSFSSSDFKTVAAFHKAQLQPVTRESDGSLWGERDGYEIKIDQGRVYDDDPYKDRVKIEYNVTPKGR